MPDATPEVKLEETGEKKSAERPAKPGEGEVNEKRPAATRPAPVATPRPPEHLPFVITHAGNLVCISNVAFKFEKLRPADTKALAEDQNFRVAHDRFSTEAIFLFFNVSLQERSKPKPQPDQIVAANVEPDGRPKEDTDESPDDMAVAVAPGTSDNTNTSRAVVVRPSPEPTPTKEQEVQMAASSQVGRLLDFIGRGEPRWPDAVGVALSLDNDQYVVRTILVEPPNAKTQPLPFVPQLISGPATVVGAPSVLPDDTEVFVSASIDLVQTYDGMKKQAELAAKELVKQIPASEKGEALDEFATFEKKAGFKIKEELLPALGNEITLAGSLKTLQGFGGLGVVPPPSPKSSSDNPDQKAINAFPILLIAVRDRDEARRLMPRVLDGMGIGQVNMIAQVEKREDTELINYGGMFAYAFVGDYVAISDTRVVRHLVEAYVNHQTLAGSNAFRNSRRWQPRQTLGEIWISPALMAGYQDAVRKSSAKMDAAMRDYLLQLSPTADAITYALSNEGLGELHELHLPKNLIIAMVAGTTAAMSAMKEGSPEMNEGIAMGFLRMIASAEDTYQATEGNGSYGSLEELEATKLVEKEMLSQYGYKFEVSASGAHFEVTATPVEYGKTGRRSFFIDQTGVVRGDDHSGAPATASDNPITGP